VTVASFQFLSVHAACRAVDSAEAVLAEPNAIFRLPPEPGLDLRRPDFFDPADAGEADRLASTDRGRSHFCIGFDSSQDHFLAGLDDVIVERRTLRGFECFRIFLDRGVALSEPVNAHYKADWPAMREFDGVAIDFQGERVPVYLHEVREPDITIEEPVLYLLDKNAASYYHWMCEVLPRLWARDAAPALRSLPMLVGDGAMTAFQHQTLVATGAAKVMPFAWRSARFKRLYLPSFLSSGEVARRLRPWFARLRALLGGGHAGGPRRLYVSRDDAQRRRVTNDAELAAALRPLGFERVTLEGRSVAEQLGLFAGAEAIVMPHGAAGANLPAVPVGALLVECHPSRLLNPCYWLMARAMDLAYGLVAAGEPDEGVDFSADMTIDPQKLLRVVGAGLAAR
jgi:hypothetical protein